MTYDAMLPSRLNPPGRMLTALLSLLALAPSNVQAHEGPPFPIVEDRRVGPYTVSVWTDPDIGTGTFFVVFEAENGEDLPAITDVIVTVAPKSGRLPEAVYHAVPKSVREGARYFTEVQFDQGEVWNVRVQIEGVQGGGEIRTEVEATPDGTIGPIGLVVYSFPFLAVGFLWAKAMLRSRKYRAEARERQAASA